MYLDKIQKTILVIFAIAMTGIVLITGKAAMNSIAKDAAKHEERLNADCSNNEEFLKLLEIPEVALYVDQQNYWDNQRINQYEFNQIKEYKKDLEFRNMVKNKIQ